MSRTFDCNDTTKIEVRSNSALCWRSDSCQCVLVFEETSLEIDFAIQVCDIHKLLTNGQLVSTVLAHNNAINDTLPANPTIPDKVANALKRKTEFDRIKRLGNPQTRADAATKARIENYLRSKGR